jgi:hypothetical protein
VMADTGPEGVSDPHYILVTPYTDAHGAMHLTLERHVDGKVSRVVLAGGSADKAWQTLCGIFDAH